MLWDEGRPSEASVDRLETVLESYVVGAKSLRMTALEILIVAVRIIGDREGRLFYLAATEARVFGGVR